MAHRANRAKSQTSNYFSHAVSLDIENKENCYRENQTTVSLNILTKPQIIFV